MNHTTQRAHTLFYHQLRGNLLALLMALSAIGGGIYYLSEQALLDNVKNNLQYHSDFRKERILSLFEQQKQWMNEISERSGLTQFSTRLFDIYHANGAESPLYQGFRDKFRREYATLLNSQEVEDLFLVTPSGELAFSLRPMEEEIAGDLTADGFYGKTILSDLVEQVLASKQLSTSRYGKTEQIEKSTVLMGIPLYSELPGEENEIIGILIRPFALQRLHDLLASYSGLGDSGEVIIAQWRGDGMGSGVNFINHFRYSDQAQPDNSCIELRRVQPKRFPVLHALSQSNGAGWMIDNTCKPVYGVWTWIPELEWGMVVKQDQTEILLPIESMRNNILFASLLIVLFLLWIAHRQARALAQPIERLINASESGKIDTLKSGAISEVNQLTTTLQQMVTVLQYNEKVLDEKVQARTTQLKQQSSEMESILASMQEGLLVIDRTGKITRANQKITSMMACAQEGDLIGRSIAEIFSTPCRFEEFINGPQNMLSTEQTLHTCSGESIPVQISTAQLQVVDDHHIDGAVLITHDLRGRIAAEQERTQQANQLAYQEGLTEMSSNVLHNIGNAVAGLNGRAEIIQGTLSPLQQIQQQLLQATTMDDLDRVKGGLQQLSTILQQLHDEKLTPSCDALLQGILHISDIITIQQQMAFGRPSISSRFSLEQILTQVISLHQDSNDKLQISTTVEIDPELDEVVLPQNQFMQMVDNLLKNGREAIAEQQQTEPHSSSPATIRLKLQQMPQDRFTLQISDSGIGISEAQQKRIFQRNVTTKATGSGIGLHAVSTFVGSLNGSIRVESDGPHQGAMFIVELPQDSATSS